MSEGWVSGCGRGVLVTAAVALVLLPARYYAPERGAGGAGGGGRAPSPPAPRSLLAAALDSPPLDLLVSAALALLGLLVYLCEWIQRKVMEKRIVKMNRFLAGSVARLRGWDAQQEQLETTLRLVQNATSEYNLLLYLITRQHAPRPDRAPEKHADPLTLDL